MHHFFELATREVQHNLFTVHTLRVFAVLVAMYGLLTLPALKWPACLDSPAGIVVAVPYLSIYLFHAIGIPGLLQNNGACGWGWCAPTLLGWVFLVFVWLAVAWLVAYAIGRIFLRADDKVTRS
jgi:branched-subunit amino acid transport protein